MAHAVIERLQSAGGDGELESLIVTTARYHQVTQVVPRHRGDDLLLVVVVDRARTNVALAAKLMAAQADTNLA